MSDLIVFPTELALRRFQQEQALKHGWVDASGHTTFARLRKLCLPHARLKGRRLGGAAELLNLRHAAEVAGGHFEGEVALGRLSRNALGDVLKQLLVELAALPEEFPRIIEWLLGHPNGGKLQQLGTLASIWRAQMKQDGFADRLDVNIAILRLLKGRRDKWPPLLRDCKQITFRSVRWFNPFEEQCVAALNHKLKVRVESALPPAHAADSADRLDQQIRSEIMAEPWAVWAEDLGDALAVDDSDVLQLAAAERIHFSRSAGTYGEIEDLARRICWNLEQGMAPNRMALVVPNIGTVQDIVPHVFSRFKIPYFFRRGRPVLSSPCVKAFVAWLAFPLRPERDAMIDLLRNPAIRFENRQAEIERLLQQPPRIEAQASPLSGLDALDILTERIIEPEDHFNAEARKAVAAALEGFGEQPMPLRDLVDLLEELLQDATIRPRDSHEQGVWILNPHDAVGLDFDLVLLAGLNEGEFPAIPQQDALLSDWERERLHAHLEEQGRRLPKMALSKADVQFEQQSVLFLSALGMAREQLVFSYQSVDQEGNEKGEGEYYRKLRNLVDAAVSPYDRWRMERAEGLIPGLGESFLPIVPLPLCRAKDEALQAAVRQGRPAACDTTTVPQAAGLLPAKHVVSMLNIEAERDAYLETPLDEREPSKYCGHLGALKEKVADWFDKRGELGPTALEALAQNRYVFLVEKVFGVRDPRVADDTPDPMERGGLIHSILQEIYTAIALGKSGVEAPRYWAVKTATGWMKRTEGGVGAVPLAVPVPEHVAFAQKVAERELNRAALGHPGVWAAERKKILEMVLNFVRHDVETCVAENRFPALFEQKFGGDTAVDLGEVKLKGVIDRIDLLFADTGELKKVRVLDYKGSSRSRSRNEDYLDEIRRNLDCQLPVYAFAAQQFFFGAFNTPESNAKTEAGYLFYERELKQVGLKLKKSLVALGEPSLTDAFLYTLYENIRRLKAGDFAVDPLIASYTDYQSLCRSEAVAIEDLD